MSREFFKTIHTDVKDENSISININIVHHHQHHRSSFIDRDSFLEFIIRMKKNKRKRKWCAQFQQKKNKLQLRNKQKKSDRPLHQQQQRYNRKSMNFYDEIKKKRAK